MNLIKQEINTKIDYWLERASSSIISDGLIWYSNANEFCYQLGLRYNRDLKIVVGLIACFSPMKEWGLNKRMVECYLKDGKCSHTKGQLLKADMINNGLIDDNYIMQQLGGLKTQSFYHNIVYPTSSDQITIDFRIWKYLKPDLWNHITPNRYSVMSECIIEKALDRGMVGCQLQSILWLTLRNSYGKFAIK